MLKQLGKYQILEQIGKGSMGMVYKAKDQNIGRIVAVKTIKLPDASDHEKKELTKRFKQEAMAAGNLNHPNIVIIYEYDEVDDIAFIAMGFVEGVELKKYFDRHEVFTQERIITIMQQLLSALEYSHQHGVIHRDIKPSNIMITSTGQVMVTDFGIARLESSDLTQVGITLGTPSYMSPEQCTGQPIDARSDIFSAGVLLYQLLTGEKPFTGPSITSILHKITQIAPPAPSQLNYSISSEFDAILDRCLAKRPADRFASAEEFSHALSRIAANQTTGTARQNFSPGQSPHQGRGSAGDEATVIPTTTGGTKGVFSSEDETIVPGGSMGLNVAQPSKAQTAAEEHPARIDEDSPSQDEATVVLNGPKTSSDTSPEEPEDATVAVPLDDLDAYMAQSNAEDDSTVVISAAEADDHLSKEKKAPPGKSEGKSPEKNRLAVNIQLPTNKYIYLGIGLIVIIALAFSLFPEKSENPASISPPPLAIEKPQPVVPAPKPEAIAEKPVAPKPEPKPEAPEQIAEKPVPAKPKPAPETKIAPAVQKEITEKPGPTSEKAGSTVSAIQPPPSQEESYIAPQTKHDVLYTYAISTTPSGANVEHGQLGRLETKTPAEAFLKSGTHQFYISKDGYHDVSIMVNIDENSSRYLEINLNPL